MEPSGRELGHWRCTPEETETSVPSFLYQCPSCHEQVTLLFFFRIQEDIINPSSFEVDILRYFLALTDMTSTGIRNGENVTVSQCRKIPKVPAGSHRKEQSATCPRGKHGFVGKHSTMSSF